MLLWIIIVVSVIFIWKTCNKPYNYWKDLKVPYMNPWASLKNVYSIIMKEKTMIECNQEIYNSYKDERYVGMYIFRTPTLLIKDLDLLKQIGIKDFDHFIDRRDLLTEDIDPLFGKNLFSLKGQKWRNMRSTLSPAFTGSKMRSMFILISECAEQFTKYFVETVDPNKATIIEMKDVFTRFANDVIASTAFGIECHSMRDKDNEFYLMGKDASHFSGTRLLKFMLCSMIPSIMKLLNIKVFSDVTNNFFRNVISNNIKSREKNGIIRPDMIHLLMEARKGKLRHETLKDEAAGFATVEESDIGKNFQFAKNDLSDDDITAQALLFFSAGFETISIVMCHMAYELALNQDVQQKLQSEIDDTLKECQENISYETIIKMKYLDMVLSETLRKWPPAVFIDRLCIEPYTIHPERPNEPTVTLRKGDAVIFPIYDLHRDPQYFPNPNKFDPERFSEENKDNIKPLSYIPFGIGPRNCIGSRFAILEAKVVFVYLLSKFSFEICEKSQVPLKLTKTQFTLNVEKGFWLQLKLRK